VIHNINAPDKPLTPALSLRERECCVEPCIAAFRRLTVLLGAFDDCMDAGGRATPGAVAEVLTR
jgi:hypothetical protein